MSKNTSNFLFNNIWKFIYYLQISNNKNTKNYKTILFNIVLHGHCEECWKKIFLEKLWRMKNNRYGECVRHYLLQIEVSLFTLTILRTAANSLVIFCVCLFREQRVTGFFIHLLIGLSTLLTPILRVSLTQRVVLEASWSIISLKWWTTLSFFSRW